MKRKLMMAGLLSLFSAVAAAEVLQFLPDAMPWRDGPRTLPVGTQMAVLEGNP